MSECPYRPIAGLDISIDGDVWPGSDYEAHLASDEHAAEREPNVVSPDPDICPECGKHMLTTGPQAISHEQWLRFEAWQRDPKSSRAERES